MRAVVQTLPLVADASTLATLEAALYLTRISTLSSAAIAAASAKFAATLDARYLAVITIATKTMQDAVKTSTDATTAAVGVLADFAA